MTPFCRTILAVFVLLWGTTTRLSADWGKVRVTPNHAGFQLAQSGEQFTPWGVNYDHDAQGRLLEDYWSEEWENLESDFREIRELGANVVRIHLQTGRFLKSPYEVNKDSLERLDDLVNLAETVGLRLNLTGLGCYHKQDVPDWYDALSEQERWRAQATFWGAIAERCADSPTIFCYDLMNEPVVGANRPAKDWLGPGFGGKHFVQRITLSQGDRSRPEIARAWIATLVEAVRAHDKSTLITVGLVPWSLDRPGLQSGFVPTECCEQLDFLSVHLYPEKDKLDEAMETLRSFQVGKPIVIEEIFPLKAGPEQVMEFLRSSRSVASGWFSFYWGKEIEEYQKGNTISDAILADWLTRFRDAGPEFREEKNLPNDD
ncbi:MAG: cellulase family glycosylhydrolase [Planctomycetaceae bacterium]|nr:cellulase family glycosylhydrolase [Planctomycetaceae bacterium]